MLSSTLTKLPSRKLLESEASDGRAVRGRQVLLMFEHYFKLRKQKTPQSSKFAGAGIEGIFLGYQNQPGFIFKSEYLVAPLHGCMT